MKKLLFLLFPALLWAQDFEFFQQWDGIPVEVDGYVVPLPWTGGFSNTRPVFCDLDGDSDFELILGQYSGQLTCFVNWGNSSSALLYPEELTWFDIDSGADSGPFFCDIDADNDLDLCVSISNGRTLLYLNSGTPENPLFGISPDTLRDHNNDAIIGTYGDFVDIDADGDYDFITGAYGVEQVNFFENTGTPEVRQFELDSSNFGNITASASSKIEFCDIDNDGDYDLFIGLYTGVVKFYRNTGTVYVPRFTLEDADWLDIDVGEDASPEFCDLDGDGDFDLFLGREHGSLGDPKGALHYWENMGTAESPDFVRVTQMYLTLDFGNRLDHKIIDFDNDGDGDLFFYYYHLGYFENSGTAAEPYFVWRSWNLGGPPSDEGTFDLGDLDNDGDMDMIFDWPGDDYEIWENVSAGTTPEYQYLSTLETAGEWSQYPALVDIDADLDLDLLTSVFSFSFTNYELWFYQNNGTPEQFSFTFVSDQFEHIISDSLRDPRFGDVDNDEDFDLMLYNKFSGRIFFFRNDGTIQNPSMTPVQGNVLGVAGSDDWRPEFYDLDGDHDLDVTIATQDGGLLFFRNTTGDTTAIAPQDASAAPTTLSLTASPNPANPSASISFDLPFRQNVLLTVYNSLGKQITTLTDEYHQAGHFDYTWQPASLASGIYFITLQTANQTQTTRIVILK